MKQFVLVWLLGSLFAVSLSAQSAPNFFQRVQENDIPTAQRGASPRSHKPLVYQTWKLDYTAVQNALKTAPWEFTPAARQHTCTLAIPVAGGVTEDFAVWQTAMMEPELAARHPYIHTYAGESLQNPGKMVRISTTARGFEAMILRADLGVEFIEPYTFDQQEYYLTYDKTDAPADPNAHLRTDMIPSSVPLATADQQPFTPRIVERGPLLETVKLKVYRYAVSTTSGFSEDHGGTLESVLSAVVNYTNQVSAVFERDINMRLQLIANQEKVIFLTPATDLFMGTEVGGWAGQNTGILNTNVGAGKYDIGHVYSKYLGGPAAGVGGLGGCSVSKGTGASSGNGTGVYETRFRVVIGQEIGHQMAGGHTWNRCDGGGGRSETTAFEPGSGSTIMSYGGVCGPDNVQNACDLYYHAGSIEEIRNYILYAEGNQCGTFVETGNTIPTVTLPYQNGFYIPIGTPFQLKGAATDSDNDPLSYCWEEIDAGPEVPLGQPDGDCAIFRTYLPDSVSYRYFPKYQYILSNSSNITEQLPTYSRALTFRLTARDNRLNGGGVGWADVKFRAWGQAGPFKVTYPNVSTITWRAGEYQNVKWDVANSDKTPVNCKKVNIRLSIDGGKTFPFLLASEVNNDGSQYVLVPNNLTFQARLKIEAVDNVFFDLSNFNFRIQAPVQPALSLGLGTDAATICQPDIFSTQILTAGTLNFSTPVALAIKSGLPSGAAASLDKTTINPGETANLTVDLSPVTQEGTYTFNVQAVAIGTTDTLLRPVTLTYYTNDFSAFALQSPADGLTGLGLVQTLHWSLGADALLYDVQVSTSPSFESGVIIASKSDLAVDSFKIPITLEKNKAYYWRVRPKNECGIHNWTEAFFFATFVENCSVFAANDLPKNISASGKPTVESSITINQGGTIQSMNVKQIKGSHAFFKDLEAHLISPGGTDITLFASKCGNYNGAFNMKLDDAALLPFSCPPSNTGTPYRPENALTPFKGQSSKGVWTLRVKDTESSSGGVLDGFQLEFCAAVALNPPFLVNNNTLILPTGESRAITEDLLRVDDANNTHSQLQFTLVSVPKRGTLFLGGTPLQTGAQFSQAQVDAGLLSFADNGSGPSSDGFRFVATDNEGGYVATPKFNINLLPVGTDEPNRRSLTFDLFPNPTDEAVWLGFDQSLESPARVRLLNSAGQLVQSVVLQAGSSGIQLTVAALPSGVYFVQVEGEAGLGIKKLVVK